MKVFLFILLSVSFSFSQPYKKCMAKGDKLEAAFKPKEALAAYLEAEKLSPENPAILIKIAKQYCDMIPKLDQVAAKSASDSALAYSRLAVAKAPLTANSHLVLALSLARSISYLPDNEKIEVTNEIKAVAAKALRLSPESDFAHHILGRWHQEVASIHIASRVAAQLGYVELPNGSFEEALAHFDKARKLNPDYPSHQTEYGRTLSMLGKKEEAITEIQKGLKMPDKDVNDLDAKQRAKETLKAQ